LSAQELDFCWRGRGVSVKQQPYSNVLVSAVLAPMAAPASAPEPPEPKIELGIRIFCDAL
jgi:hypothetical protein